MIKVKIVMVREQVEQTPYRNNVDPKQYNRRLKVRLDWRGYWVPRPLA